MRRAILHPAAALAAGLAAAPAAADLSVAEFWEHWQAGAPDAGRSVTAERVRDRDRGLDIAGFRIVHEDDEVRLSLRIERLALRPNGDAVRVTLPEDQLVTLRADPADDDAMVVPLRLARGALTVDATGTPGALDYALAAPALSLQLEPVAATPEGLESLEIGVDGMAGRLAGLSGDDTPLSADLTAAALTLALDHAIENADLSLAAAQRDLTLDVRLDEAARDGTIALTAGSARMRTRQTNPTGTHVTDSRQENLVLDLAFEDGRGDLALSAENLSWRLESPRLPVSPVGISADGSELALSFPRDVDAPAPARLRLDLQGLEAGEALWSAIDPQGSLPRRAANFTADIEAEFAPAAPPAALLPDGAEAMAPPLPRRLTIHELALDLEDLTVGAEGTFELPLDEAAAGPTFPVGELDIAARGATGFLEQLVAAGIVSPEQAMGAQMMMGMFATQGEGDVLRSRIETTPEGGVLVNGNRMR